MKSKITHIDPKGTWSNTSGTFNKYQVSLANGNSYSFLARGEFKKKIGQEIEYEVTNEQYNTAKIVYPKPQNNLNTQSKPLDTHNSILRQVAFKGAIELASSGKINIEEIREFTNEFNKILK
jgi:hypothetical protein